MLAVGLAAIAVARICRRPNSESPTRPLLAAIVLATYGFVGFKAGFVRHDLHSIIAWDILALAAAAYTAFVCRGLLSLLAIFHRYCALGSFRRRIPDTPCAGSYLFWLRYAVVV
jgi:hypothetical protein